MERKTSSTVDAGSVYDLNKAWIRSRGTDTFSEGEVEIIKHAVTNAGMEWNGVQQALGQGLRPPIIDFNVYWFPAGMVELIPGYETSARDRIKRNFYELKYDTSIIGKLTEAEKVIFGRFGEQVGQLFGTLIQAWYLEMKAKLVTLDIRSVNEDCSVYEDICLKYTEEFHTQYEILYGKLPKPDDGKGRRLVLTTGIAAKLCLFMLLHDRCFALIARMVRSRRWEQIGLVQIERSAIPDDCKNCPICFEEMGVVSPEDEVDQGIKLAACCEQIIGEVCLQTSLDFDNRCPLCRYRF
ncbi:hypothetical protein PVAG01_05126 [Phlyctema vagabunda]|uniref:RING-type domain-containing protein n=1 Tax=Phlyctema vagabunda TaxID=108571 RepID=A0ABR4PJ53_9HELO